ncbi:MAG: catalase [Gammaproteobacteria bacterium]|nr:catalase [Gammaproteobacteria bacterium]
MNVQFGTGFTISQNNTSTQGSDARTGVAVPVESEDQSTTSFIPVQEATEAPQSRQEGAEQGVEQRQAVEQRRARQQQQDIQAQQQRERRAEQDQLDARAQEQQRLSRNEEQQNQRGDEALEDRTQEEQQAQARREQDAQEQRQLEAEQRQLQQLAERDREVRAHEQAHQSVGGQYAGAMSLAYERGPDGKNYAVAGEVPIDTGKVANNPQATLDKAETIRRAALAPAEPSSQDRRVAAQAIQMTLEARAEIQQQQREEQLTEQDVSEEQSESESLSEEERLDAEQKAQQEQQQRETTENVTADLQELNERMARIQAQLVEASQFEDKINSKVNLLDVTT